MRVICLLSALLAGEGLSARSQILHVVSQQVGYSSALRLATGLTGVELTSVIKQLSNGGVSVCDLGDTCKAFYADAHGLLHQFISYRGKLYESSFLASQVWGDWQPADFENVAISNDIGKLRELSERSLASLDYHTSQPPVARVRLLEFLTRPDIVAKLRNGIGVSSDQVATALGHDDARFIGRQISQLKQELNIELKTRRGDSAKIWVYTGVDPIPNYLSLPPDIHARLRELFTRPDVVTKLQDGTGVRPAQVGKDLGLDDIASIGRQIGEIKQELNIELKMRRGDYAMVWVYTEVDPIPNYPSLPPDIHARLRKFLTRPDIAAKLQDGTGVSSDQAATALGVDDVRSIRLQIIQFKQELGIEERTRRGDHIKVWVHTGVDPIPNYPSLPPDIHAQLREFLARPDIAAKLKGTGITSAQVGEALKFASARSAARKIRQFKQELGLELRTRRGDRQNVWVLVGVDPIPNYKKR